MNNDLNKVINKVIKDDWNQMITIEGKFNHLKKICEKINISPKCLTVDENIEIETSNKTKHVLEFEKNKRLTDYISTVE